jgi:hypothetical protein
MSLDMVVSFRLIERNTESIAMNDVNVFVTLGSDTFQFRFSRVPAVGEQVRINGNVYVVRSVLHTPSAQAIETAAAEILVSLVR